MGRVAVAGACLGLLLFSSACALERTVEGAAPVKEGEVRAVDDSGRDGSPDPTAGRRGALPGGEAASCVERYDPQAVTGRAFAFDGVVVAVGDSVSDRGDEGDLGLPGVTFEVREWFSGGRGDTVTVDLQPPTTGSDEPSDPGYAYGVGSRLLVSGEARWGGSPLEEPIAWGCGFSRYHDAETAAAWREALVR